MQKPGGDSYHAAPQTVLSERRITPRTAVRTTGLGFLLSTGVREKEKREEKRARFVRFLACVQAGLVGVPTARAAAASVVEAFLAASFPRSPSDSITSSDGSHLLTPHQTHNPPNSKMADVETKTTEVSTNNN